MPRVPTQERRTTQDQQAGSPFVQAGASEISRASESIARAGAATANLLAKMAEDEKQKTDRAVYSKNIGDLATFQGQLDVEARQRRGAAAFVPSSVAGDALKAWDDRYGEILGGLADDDQRRSVELRAAEMRTAFGISLGQYEAGERHKTYLGSLDAEAAASADLAVGYRANPKLMANEMANGVASIEKTAMALGESEAEVNQRVVGYRSGVYEKAISGLIDDGAVDSAQGLFDEIKGQSDESGPMMLEEHEASAAGKLRAGQQTHSAVKIATDVLSIIKGPRITAEQSAEVEARLVEAENANPQLIGQIRPIVRNRENAVKQAWAQHQDQAYNYSMERVEAGTPYEQLRASDLADMEPRHRASLRQQAANMASAQMDRPTDPLWLRRWEQRQLPDGSWVDRTPAEKMADNEFVYFPYLSNAMRETIRLEKNGYERSGATGQKGLNAASIEQELSAQMAVLGIGGGDDFMEQRGAFKSEAYRRIQQFMDRTGHPPDNTEMREHVFAPMELDVVYKRASWLGLRREDVTIDVGLLGTLTAEQRASVSIPDERIPTPHFNAIARMLTDGRTDPDAATDPSADPVDVEQVELIYGQYMAGLLPPEQNSKVEAALGAADEILGERKVQGVASEFSSVVAPALFSKGGASIPDDLYDLARRTLVADGMTTTNANIRQKAIEIRTGELLENRGLLLIPAEIRAAETARGIRSDPKFVYKPDPKTLRYYALLDFLPEEEARVRSGIGQAPPPGLEPRLPSTRKDNSEPPRTFKTVGSE